MMKKERFVEVINFIKEQRKKEDEFCTVLEKMCGDDKFPMPAFIYTEYEDLLVKILQEEFDDRDDLIGYYLYEFDDLAEEEKQKQIAHMPQLASLDDMYDYLIKEWLGNNIGE